MTIPEPVVPDDEQLPPDPRSDPAATVDALERRIERQEGGPASPARPPGHAGDLDEPPD